MNHTYTIIGGKLTKVWVTADGARVLSSARYHDWSPMKKHIHQQHANQLQQKYDTTQN